MQEPNFFGVGAAKSGTTAIWQFLKAHPEVSMPDDILFKETCYFAQGSRFAVRSKDQYLSLFAHNPAAKAVGETCHAYLTSPESAGAIREAFPDAKVFMVLRDPAERALSLYRHLASHGFETITTFHEALAAEDARRADPGFAKACAQGYEHSYYYFGSGLYSEQVERYLGVFPRDQIKIFLYDDLKRNPMSVVRTLYEFIGVDADFIPEIRRHNEGRWPLSVKTQYFLLQDYYAALPQGPSLPGKVIRRALGPLRDPLVDINLRLGAISGPPSCDDMVEALRERYNDDRERLARLIDRNLDGWAPRR